MQAQRAAFSCAKSEFVNIPHPPCHMQVWLAEWTGCEVAVKELLGFASDSEASRAWTEMQNEVKKERKGMMGGGGGAGLG